MRNEYVRMIMVNIGKHQVIVIPILVTNVLSPILVLSYNEVQMIIPGIVLSVRKDRAFELPE